MASKTERCPLCGLQIDQSTRFIVRVAGWQYLSCASCKAKWDAATEKLFASMRPLKPEAEHGKP